MRTQTWEQEQRIQRNRRQKAMRFVEHFYHQMRAAGVQTPETNRAALETALATVRSASQEQWAALAKSMTEENQKRGVNKKEDPPSGATFELIVGELQEAIARLDHAKKQADEDQQLFSELLRQRRDTEVEDAQAGRLP